MNDCAKLQMEFVWEGKKIQLKGKEQVISKTVTMHRLQALCGGEDIDQLYEVQLREFAMDEAKGQRDMDSTPITFDAPPEIIKVLQSYTHLFQAPIGLPLYRANDHRIHLFPGTSAVNVKPYRCPHMLKQTMTQIVEEMLQQGLLRPSHSLYSDGFVY